MSGAPKLSEHVRPVATAARVERQGAALAQAGLPGALPMRARRVPWIAAGLLVGAMAAAALLLRAPASLPAGALVESAQAEVAVQLDDGSRVELSPESQLRLLENQSGAVALELRSGTARFHVKHAPARRFQVQAGPIEVRVIGTRFELTRKREPGGVLARVAVSEGVVEVRRRDGSDGVQRIRAGESWSALVPNAAPASPPPEPSPAASQPPARAVEPAQAHGTLPAADRVALEPREEPLAAEPGEVEGDRGQATPERSASAVFRRASLARRAGRMQEAADAYAELLVQYPDDARAGLSAFELGRIRMDALADPAGAIQALDRAVAAGRGASFHEDALARIVVASDALGRADACRQARERYLVRYPSGVHAHALAARCR